MEKIGMDKVAVVILNYMNYRETFCCADSVLLQKNIDFKIIIVDNGSTNDSYTQLKRRYYRNPSVYILKTGKNYGCAKGNNIGIKYGKTKLFADFILLLNSDTKMIQKDFISKLLLGYKKNMGAMGGKIIQQNGMIQERYFDYVTFPGTLFLYLKLICDRYSIPILPEKLSVFLEKANKTEILHGSCLMLTPAFFEKYDLLYDKTFLYGEEILLYIFCKRAGLIQKKIQDAVILHKGKQSSSYLYGNRNSLRDKYVLSSFKYVVWESLKTRLQYGVGRI